MASRVLIHIGTAKTGTTSIQQALFEGHAAGAIGAASYPTPDGRPNHRTLATLYLPHDRLPRQLKSRYPAHDRDFHAMQQRYRRSLFRDLRASHTAILSAEHFTFLDATEVGHLRRDLEEAGFSLFHVVLYIRDPVDYFLSEAQQLLKASHRLTDPAVFRYPFVRFAHTWETCFPGRLIVRRFSRDPTFDVVSDFSSVLRERLGVSLPPFESQLNRAMSAEGMDILQRYRSSFWLHEDHVFTADTNQLVSFLMRSWETLAQTRAELKPEVASWIRFTHREDAAYVRDRYGVDLGYGDECEPAPLSRPSGGEWRVSNIVRHVDPEVVNALLLHYARWRPRRNDTRRSLEQRFHDWLIRVIRTGRRS